MPVTAKLSRKFYETLGDDIANELVEWFNQVDATYRADLRELNELNFARFEASVKQQMAELAAMVERRITQVATELGERVSAIESKFEKQIAALDSKIEKRIAELESKFEGQLGELFKYYYQMKKHMLQRLYYAINILKIYLSL